MKCTPTRKSLLLRRDFSLFIGRVLFGLVPSVSYEKVFLEKCPWGGQRVFIGPKLYVNGSFEYNTIQSSFDETGLLFLESIPLHGILTFPKFVDSLHEININPGPF